MRQAGGEGGSSTREGDDDNGVIGLAKNSQGNEGERGAEGGWEGETERGSDRIRFEAGAASRVRLLAV